MESPFEKLKVDPELACEFLGVFARFEYALKTGGFPIGDESGVNPAWDEFARTIDAKFDPTASDELGRAVDYLLNRPPKKQVLVNGNLQWRESAPDAHLPRAERVLLMVRRVRNNLFHGGKFLASEGENDNRDQMLVEHALNVLRACVALEDRVHATYQN